jgi:hypothetical protein
MDTMTKRTPTPRISTMMRNIRASYDAATLEERSAGLHWYDSARDLAGYLAAKYWVNPEVAAAVIAAHSMNASWTVNIARAESQLAGRPVGLSRAIRMGAAAMADPTNALSHIVGPKLNPFAHCIAGDLSRVATDRWAQRAAFASSDDKLCDRLIARKGVRDTMIDAYSKVAADVGLEPAVLQAIVWVQVRGGAL